jgi:predicted ester cyclase
VLEQNKFLIYRFVDQMLNKRNPDVIDELVAPDFVDHDAPPGQAPGPEGVKRTLEAVETALGDFRVLTDDIIAEGDRVVTRHTAEATHIGPFLGFAPTGRRLRWTAISIYRIADGRIAERWGLMDYRGLQRQLAV